MARTLLNDVIHEQIVAAVRTGAPFGHAASSAGIGTRTLYDWLARGERYDLAVESGLQPPEGDEPFSRLRRDIYAARANVRIIAVATIQRAIRGERDEETGTWVIFPDWKAAAWYLERSAPEEYGRRWAPETAQAVSAEEELDALVARGLALLEEHAQPE